jgi:Uma2 family endonuclease
MPVQLAQRLISVKEYHKMIEAGILTPADRVELIRGQIIQMGPVGSKHAACVRKIDALFNKLLPEEQAIVSSQNPIRIPDFSEPEPDIAVLRYREDYYAEGHPGPEDILLIIEVSDATYDYDKQMKMPIYAEAGIPEYWIVNLNTNEIEAYHNPEEGKYLMMERFIPGKKAVFYGGQQEVDTKIEIEVEKLIA